MNQKLSTDLFTYLINDDLNSFMKLVPSIFPIYSFPTTFITDLSNYSLLIDQNQLV